MPNVNREKIYLALNFWRMERIGDDWRRSGLEEVKSFVGNIQSQNPSYSLSSADCLALCYFHTLSSFLVCIFGAGNVPQRIHQENTNVFIAGLRNRDYNDYFAWYRNILADLGFTQTDLQSVDKILKDLRVWITKNL
jgi:hypothetical protein